MRVLFATSEAYPLSKTGGLGDVCGSLPRALRAQGVDVRIALPAYAHAMEKAGSTRLVAEVRVPLADKPVRILEGLLPEQDVPVFLIDAPCLYDRPGTPYHDSDGREFPDNALRFAVYAQVVTAMCQGRVPGIDWTPDLVHCHDWTSGLVPALLTREKRRPATVFTIHNLAHQGLYSYDSFRQLGLPPAWWSLEKLEFHGRLSFMKGGLVFSDWLTTVSPTYAREICRPDMGCGLDGLLRWRRERLLGVLNGCDYEVWDPSHDPLIVRTYEPATVEEGKAENKRALQRLFGFAESASTPLFTLVSRLVEQKGVDLLALALPRLMAAKAQVVVLGRGDERFALALTQLAAKWPRQLAVWVGYSEELAHRLTAGADAFIMPSRFEPCGLNQMYSLRYGTLPIVRRTGGLADTVVDATAENVRADKATGFTFDAPSVDALWGAVERSLAMWNTRQDGRWAQMVQAGMRLDYGWERGASAYHALYRKALGIDGPPPAQRDAALHHEARP